MLSCFSHLLLFGAPWTIAHQAPLSMEFSKQEYWKVVKNLPAMQETQDTQVRSLGQEGTLEEGMATHSSILAWRIP